MAAPPLPPPPGTLGKRLVNLGIAGHTLIYRLSGGRLLNRFPKSGAPVFLLTHVGRKSGKRRTMPLLYLADGENLIIVASNAGAPKHPAWFLNVRDAGEVEAQVGSERSRRKVRVLGGEERTAAWTRLVEMYPEYALYAERAEGKREIPVIELSPVG